VTRLVDRLAKKGWVRRVDCEEDRRRRYVTCTPAGRRVLDAVEPGLLALHASQFAKLTPADRDALIRLLEAVRRAASENDATLQEDERG
jgi:DNA-binding MarR family transcriptional regulator